MPFPGRTLTAQLVWPVVGLVLVAVLANVAFAAWLATRSAVLAARAGRERIVAALDRSRIALVPAVLDALGDLTGSELVVWDDAADAAGATTLAPERLAEATAALKTARDGDVIELAGTRHAVAIVRAAGVRPETRARAHAGEQPRGHAPGQRPGRCSPSPPPRSPCSCRWGSRPPERIARRIAAIERHVERIAQGEFGDTWPPRRATTRSAGSRRAWNG